MPSNKGIRYRRQLRRCGFRSWKRANQRRGELIDIAFSGDEESATESELRELQELQKLADLFLAWKCQAENRRLYNRQRYICKKAGIDWKLITGK